MGDHVSGHLPVIYACFHDTPASWGDPLERVSAFRETSVAAANQVHQRHHRTDVGLSHCTGLTFYPTGIDGGMGTGPMVMVLPG